MNIVFPALAIAFAAFCVWLAVRVVNRRERWAKWTALGVVAVFVGYPLCMGPANWLLMRVNCPEWIESALAVFYSPIDWAANYWPEWIDDIVFNYLNWGIPQ